MVFTPPLIFRDLTPPPYPGLQLGARLRGRTTTHALDVKFLGPSLAGNLLRKPRIAGATLKGGSENLHRQGGKIAENRTLTDVHRRYFWVYGRFSAPNILGKKGKHTHKKKARNSLERKKSKEIQKSKEKKIRVQARREKNTTKSQQIVSPLGFIPFIVALADGLQKHAVACPGLLSAVRAPMARCGRCARPSLREAEQHKIQCHAEGQQDTEEST